MINKIGFGLIILSLFLAFVYGTEKFTSDNPSDSALIRIGLSSIDSSSCKICELNEIYYESGCKRCIQDGIVLTAHVSNEKLYNIGWSQNNGMYYGDNNCDGLTLFENTSTKVNDTYYIEIEKNKLDLKTNFYTDKNFSNLQESVSIEMCSNPDNLQFIRISNEDGKPPGNGGKLSGYIDDIEIFDISNEKQLSIFSTSFDECLDSSCSNLWKFRNTEKISIDTKNNNLSFSSEVLGVNDYGHLRLDDELPDSWKMYFKFHINELEEHPRGKGILKIDPQLRQMVLGIPILILPLIGYGITRKIKSKIFGSLMIILGILISSSMLINQNFDTNNIPSLYPSLFIIGLSILIIILGIFKMRIRKKINYETNN